jgi:hypothetical protein
MLNGTGQLPDDGLRTSHLRRDGEPMMSAWHKDSELTEGQKRLNAILIFVVFMLAVVGLQALTGG